MHASACAAIVCHHRPNFIRSPGVGEFPDTPSYAPDTAALRLPVISKSLAHQRLYCIVESRPMGGGTGRAANLDGFMRIDIARLQMLREAAKERSRHIAERMERIESGRLRLWSRMNHLRAELDARKHDTARADGVTDDRVEGEDVAADDVADKHGVTAGGGDGARAAPV